LRQVARAAAQVFEEPRILDRDDRLVSERRDQCDLFFGERLNPLAGEHDDAD
jgi:hypothetical protein